MPRPSLKTPQLIERMLALHSAGASAREIAEQLDINHRTATLWLRDSGLRPNGGYGRRGTRERVEPEGIEAAVVAAQQSLAELATTAPADASDRMALAAKSLALIQTLLRQEGDRLQAGHGKINDLGKRLEIENMLATRIEEFRPRAAPKPEEDISNLEAASETRSKFAALVESSERDFKCACCGGDPYGRTGHK